MQTTTCKRAACGLAVPPYQRAKPIYLQSNATDASRGRPPAFFETLALIKYGICDGIYRILGRESTISEIPVFKIPIFGKSGKICYLFTYKITYLATKICIYK